MYVYIYDSLTTKKKHHKTLINIEKRITDLGLNGKIVRLKGIKNVIDTIKNEIRYGAKTVVAVGDDLTVNRTLNAVATSEIDQVRSGASLGIIPIEEKNNLIAKSLGIKDAKSACDILLARRTMEIKLPKINDIFFASQTTIVNPENFLQINNDFSVKITEPGKINVINFPFDPFLFHKLKSDPNDEILELFIQTKGGRISKHKNQSIFKINKLDIKNKDTKILIDNCLNITPPAKIKTTNRKINFIVGKKRVF